MEQTRSSRASTQASAPSPAPGRQQEQVGSTTSTRTAPQCLQPQPASSPGLLLSYSKYLSARLCVLTDLWASGSTEPRVKSPAKTALKEPVGKGGEEGEKGKGGPAVGYSWRRREQGVKWYRSTGTGGGVVPLTHPFLPPGSRLAPWCQTRAAPRLAAPRSNSEARSLSTRTLLPRAATIKAATPRTPGSGPQGGGISSPPVFPGLLATSVLQQLCSKGSLGTQRPCKSSWG